MTWFISERACGKCFSLFLCVVMEHRIPSTWGCWCYALLMNFASLIQGWKWSLPFVLGTKRRKEIGEKQRGENEERDGIWSKQGDPYPWYLRLLTDSETKAAVHSLVNALVSLLQLSLLQKGAVPGQSFAAPDFPQYDWQPEGLSL